MVIVGCFSRALGAGPASAWRWKDAGVIEPFQRQSRAADVAFCRAPIGGIGARLQLRALRRVRLLRSSGRRVPGRGILAGSSPDMTDAPRDPAAWSTAREAVAVCCQQVVLRRTVRIALLVGTILSAINQGGVIVGGDASGVTWLRVAANYVIPFCVSNAGVLSGTRAPGDRGRASSWGSRRSRGG